MSIVIALDQGTTSSRSIAFDLELGVQVTAQKEFAQHFPQSGWVEHDAEEIWASQLATLKQVLGQLPNGESAKSGVKTAQAAAFLIANDRQKTLPKIAALAITNQRETTLLWHRSTGQPVGRAIVWQDRRTAARCAQLAQEGHAKAIARKTGLVLDAYFSATKLEWLLDHTPGARAAAGRGELCFGTVDSWLIYRLTGGRVHATDVSNASRTMLLNLHTLQWDESLLKLFRIPHSVLPQVLPSSGLFGHTDPAVVGARIPITGVAGDQQAATFGQTCFAPGSAKNTYGTGCFMLMNTGSRPVVSQRRLLTTVGWQGSGSGPAAYCLEGSVFMGGATVQWLRDGLGIIQNASEVEALAASVEDSGDVKLVPAFAGLGAPYWDGFARGTLVGMTRGTTRAHIARAALEAIALQTADVFEAMQADSGIALQELRVDGGAAANNLLMQIQANVLGVPVLRPKVLETTALGAAMLAGLAVGAWQNGEELMRLTQTVGALNRRFEPQWGRAQRAAELARWRQAVERSRGWARA